MPFSAPGEKHKRTLVKYEGTKTPSTPRFAIPHYNSSSTSSTTPPSSASLCGPPLCTNDIVNSTTSTSAASSAPSISASSADLSNAYPSNTPTCPPNSDSTTDNCSPASVNTMSPTAPSITSTQSYPMNTTTPVTPTSNGVSLPTITSTNTNLSGTPTTSSRVASGPETSSSPIPRSGNLSTNDKIKAVIGGVVGGVSLLVLVLFVLYFRKRLSRRLKRLRGNNIAPSAEFMHHAALSPAFHDRSFSTSPRPLLRQESATLRVYPGHEQQYSDHLPSFTPGAFTDPVIEKVNSAAQQQQAHLHQPPAYDATRDASTSMYSSTHSSASFHTYEVDDHTVPSTSPILADESDVGHQSSVSHGESFGGGRTRASESVEGGARAVGWAL